MQLSIRTDCILWAGLVGSAVAHRKFPSDADILATDWQGWNHLRVCECDRVDALGEGRIIEDDVKRHRVCGTPASVSRPFDYLALKSDVRNSHEVGRPEIFVATKPLVWHIVRRGGDQPDAISNETNEENREHRYGDVSQGAPPSGGPRLDASPSQSQVPFCLKYSPRTARPFLMLEHHTFHGSSILPLKVAFRDSARFRSSLVCS